MSYNELIKSGKEIKLLNSINALLSWDMEVNMPKNADKNFRAEQVGLIAGLSFEKFTSKKFEDLLDKCSNEKSTDELQTKNIEKLKIALQKAKKFSKEFVEKESILTSKVHNVWVEAKTKSDFSIYENSLGEIVDLCKEKAEILGYKKSPYDALLNEFEEGCNVEFLDKLFSDVAVNLKPLISNIQEKQKISTNFLQQFFEPQKQLELTKEILEVLKVSSENYHMGLANHPFCTSFHPTDVRITTRIDDHNLGAVIWSAIHELGHSMYEMGLNKEFIGMPIAEATSLGIHESQSRFWENNICRTPEFIDLIFPLMVNKFPKELQKATSKDIFNEINFVTPTLIRTEADEVTYHYHIMVRYEIEKRLIEGTLKVKDVKEYWNEMYLKYLGLSPKNDANGILQDIHWSFGGIGYFPTYSLGSFYAAQWYDTIGNTIDLPKAIKLGNFEEIQKWHNQNIHVHGQLLTSNEICLKATGNSLNFEYFEKYIKNKLDI